MHRVGGLFRTCFLSWGKTILKFSNSLIGNILHHIICKEGIAIHVSHISCGGLSHLSIFSWNINSLPCSWHSWATSFTVCATTAIYPTMIIVRGVCINFTQRFVGWCTTFSSFLYSLAINSSGLSSFR